MTAGVEEELFIRAKRLESSEKVLGVAAAVGGGDRVLCDFSLDQGFEVSVVLFLPMPKAGTETPALPSLFIAAVFRPPLEVGAGLGVGATASYAGGGGETGVEIPAEF